MRSAVSDVSCTDIHWFHSSLQVKLCVLGVRHIHH